MQPLFPIYLLRHGETVWNAEGRLQGSMDSPLTARGIQQAIAMAKALEARLDTLLDWDLVSSPLGRAIKTADIIAGHCNLRGRLDDNLREISFGAWTNMTWDEVEHSNPGASTRRGRAFHSPNGETFEEAEARAIDFLRFIQGPTIAVSHGIFGQVIRGVYLAEEDHSEPHRSTQDGLYLLADGQIEFIECL